MPTVGPTELIVILVIVLVIFGAGRLSEVGSALGKTVRGFKEATTEEEVEKKPDREAEKRADEDPEKRDQGPTSS